MDKGLTLAKIKARGNYDSVLILGMRTGLECVIYDHSQIKDIREYSPAGPPSTNASLRAATPAAAAAAAPVNPPPSKSIEKASGTEPIPTPTLATL